MRQLVTRVFAFFEARTAPFPERPLVNPPRGFLPFCWYFSRPLAVPLLLMSLTTALIAISEVSLFAFLGNLVDWLATQDVETFFAQQWLTLLGMASVLLLALPVLIGVHALLVHQSLLGNFPMALRWSLHRYLLHQSVSYYHDEFAGRIATKVMQTSLSVREFVMKLLDIFVFVSVYFFSMMVH